MRRAVLVLALLLAAGTGTALAVHNPNPPSCTDTGDRVTKLDLIEHLMRAPQVFILGSSRARVAMPATVEKLTGGTAFNAGVHGGGAADEYVFARLLAQRFPHASPAYLIFVDVSIAGDGVNPELADEPLARPFLGSAASSKKTTCVPNGFYTADGGLAYSPALNKAQREERVASQLPHALAAIPGDAKQSRHISPRSTKWFRKLLGFINARGGKPVIVLNPIYPAVLAAREKYGFPELDAARTYLAWLRTRYRFVLVNGEDIRTWRGKASDFWSIDHIDRKNMDRLLRYVVRRSGDVLTKPKLLRYGRRVEIREARANDAAAVAALLGELGYATSAEEAALRLKRLREETQTLVLVAEVDGAVTALGGIRTEWPLEHDEPWARLIALVVGEHHRGHGIGARLLGALEAEATSRGCVAVVLNSGNHRHEAHVFYERCGYEATGKRFAKVLD